MTIFESWHSSRAFGRALELPLLASMARVLAVILSVYLWIRFLDMSHRHVFGLLAQNRIETWLFALEIGLLIVPMVLLYQAKVRRQPGGAICLRRNGRLRFHRQPAECRHDRPGGRFGDPLHSALERGCGHAFDCGGRVCHLPFRCRLLPGI